MIGRPGPRSLVLLGWFFYTLSVGDSFTQGYPWGYREGVAEPVARGPYVTLVICESIARQWSQWTRWRHLVVPAAPGVACWPADERAR